MSDWTNEFVQVRNNTEKNIQWDGRDYPAGSTRTVPYLNMINGFGDPRSTNGSHQVFRATNGEQGVIQPRESERIKVSNIWGIGNGGTNTWEDIPHLEFFDMESGEKLYTVVEDPLGNHTAPANPTIEQQTVLQKTVERQQQVINRLLEVAGLDADAIPQSLTTVALDTAPDVPSEIPTDDSTADETQSPWAHDGIPTIDEDE